MIVGEKDLAKAEPDPVAHHLPLGSLTAVEQYGLAFPLNRERRHVALDRGTGGRGTQEGDGQHGQNIRRVVG